MLSGGPFTKRLGVVLGGRIGSSIRSLCQAYTNFNHSQKQRPSQSIFVLEAYVHMHYCDSRFLALNRHFVAPLYSSSVTHKHPPALSLTFTPLLCKQNPQYLLLPFHPQVLAARATRKPPKAQLHTTPHKTICLRIRYDFADVAFETRLL